MLASSLLEVEKMRPLSLQCLPICLFLCVDVTILES